MAALLINLRYNLALCKDAQPPTTSAVMSAHSAPDGAIHYDQSVASSALVGRAGGGAGERPEGGTSMARLARQTQNIRNVLRSIVMPQSGVPSETGELVLQALVGRVEEAQVQANMDSAIHIFGDSALVPRLNSARARPRTGKAVKARRSRATRHHPYSAGQMTESVGSRVQASTLPTDGASTTDSNGSGLGPHSRS